jgi:hypothetical protein
MNLPDYSILSVRRNVGGCCDHCGRNLKHVVQLKENATNKVLELGTGCVLTVTGKNLKKIYAEEKIYNSELREENIASQGKVRIQEFMEVNPEMMSYIEKNIDNSFIKNMYNMIQEQGTLTPNMYNTVYSMMLPLAQELNPKDVIAKVIKIVKKNTDFGTTWTLLVENDGKLTRLFFSTLNAKNNDLFLELDLIDSDGDALIDPLSRDIMVKFSGTFDGYKVKRVKITKG